MPTVGAVPTTRLPLPGAQCPVAQGGYSEVAAGRRSLRRAGSASLPEETLLDDNVWFLPTFIENLEDGYHWEKESGVPPVCMWPVENGCS